MAFGKHSWALTSTEKEIKKGRKRQILMYFWALGFVEQNFTLFLHLRELPAYKLAYWVSLWQHKHTHTYTQIHKQIYGISGWLYLGALNVLQQRAGPFGKLRRIAPTVHNRSHSLIHTHTFSHTHVNRVPLAPWSFILQRKGRAKAFEAPFMPSPWATSRRN